MSEYSHTGAGNSTPETCLKFTEFVQSHIKGVLAPTALNVLSTQNYRIEAESGISLLPITRAEFAMGAQSNIRRLILGCEDGTDEGEPLLHLRYKPTLERPSIEVLWGDISTYAQEGFVLNIMKRFEDLEALGHIVMVDQRG